MSGIERPSDKRSGVSPSPWVGHNRYESAQVVARDSRPSDRILARSASAFVNSNVLGSQRLLAVLLASATPSAASFRFKCGSNLGPPEPSLQDFPA
jgi:hypothetical protein